MSAQHRTQVLRAYRELLGLVRRLPEQQRSVQRAEARAALRLHAAEADEAKRQDLFKQLAAKISFLRAVTPRRPGEVSSIGAGHYVLRGGQLVEGSGETSGTRCGCCPAALLPLLMLLCLLAVSGAPT
jgi:hypothetical protein